VGASVVHRKLRGYTDWREVVADVESAASAVNAELDDVKSVIETIQAEFVPPQ
jgi:hypothetical protein